MADNLGIQPYLDQGFALVKTDDIDGIHHPIFKVEYGADGSATQVSPTNPLPIIDNVLSESFDEAEYLSTYLLDTAAIDMAVDGTTPVTYKYTVPAGKIFYIKRGFLVLEDGNVAFIPGNFGALGAAITNGVSVGITPSGGARVEIENWKTNRQIRDTMFDFNTEFRVDGAYVGRWSFTKDMTFSGVVLTAGDIFDFVIQDNLLGLDYLSFKLKGILDAA